MKKIEIGSGTHATDEFIHTDIRKLPGIDVVCDARNLPFRDGTFDVVLSKHVIEHFSWRETDALLQEWVRILKPGGKISIQCPNLAYLCKYYAAWLRKFHSRSKPPAIWFGPESDIFGGQKQEFDYHKTGFSFETLAERLKMAGIHKVADLTSINKRLNRQYQLHLEGEKKKAKRHQFS